METGRGRMDRTAPAVLFALSFVLCAGFALAAKPLPVTDEFLTYYRIAQNIAAGNGFTEDGSTPYVYLPPFFSCLLGLWFLLTGHQALFSVQIFQSLFIAASAACSYYLFQEVFAREKAALAAAGWVAIHPSLWTYSVFVRQEPTILLLTTVAAWCTLRWLRLSGYARAALAGGLWGLATLSKTVTLFVPLLLLAFCLLRRGKEETRIAFPEVAAAIISFFLVIAPWTARNYYHFHRLIPVNDQGLGMLEWNVQHSDAPADERKRMPELLLATLQAKDATRGELAGEKYLAELDRKGVSGNEREKKLWEYILSHKKYFLIQRLRNAIYFAAPVVDWWIVTGRWRSFLWEPGKNLPYWAFTLFLHAPFYLFLTWRLFRCLRGGLDPPRSFLLLLYIGYWAVYTLFWGETRFAIPVYPVLVALAPWDRIFSKT